MPVTLTTSRASELERLLRRAAQKRLSNTEAKRAEELIRYPEYSNQNCRLCIETGKREKAIYDTGFCQDHNYLMLRVLSRRP